MIIAYSDFLDQIYKEMLTEDEWNLKESWKRETVESPENGEDDVVGGEAGHDRQRHFHEQQREERRPAAISEINLIEKRYELYLTFTNKLYQ